MKLLIARSDVHRYYSGSDIWFNVKQASERVAF